MSNLNSRNITIEAMEDDDNLVETPSQKKGSFDAKNYLNVRLDIERGELSKELKIRLLPIDKDSSTPFKRIKMHNIRVPKEISPSGYKSYACLEKVDDIDHEKYGNKCPFCETNRDAYKKSTEATNDVDKKRWQEISLANRAGDVGIIRCIERGHEDDGPKFWKFNIRQDKKDPLNVIKKLFQTRLQESRDEGEDDLNILDLYEGKDLKITITAVLDKNTNKPTNKTTIDITDYGKVKPLTTDETQLELWVNDPKVWSDVFVPKTYDYLAILLNGDIPWFDRNSSKWIPKSSLDKDNEEKKENEKKESEESDKKINDADEKLIKQAQSSKKIEVSVSTSSNANTYDEEELPF